MPVKPLFVMFSLMALGCAGQAAPLVPTRVLPLPGVTGRIDHFAHDAEGSRLFVAALGNNTVEVLDLKVGHVVHSISGLAEPQGVVYLKDGNRLYVSNGGDGTLRVFDGTVFNLITQVKFAGDADNLRYDETNKLIYVGYGSGALGVVDAGKNVVVGDIRLSAHPESFQLETKGSDVFVNTPGSHEIVRVDRREKKVVGTWSLGMVGANFPLALDEAKHRAFVACRFPARLLVYDTKTGRRIEKADLHGDCDDLFYDGTRKRLYATCGEGFIDVFEETDDGRFVRKAEIATVEKARTGFFDGENLYLAVPQQRERPAEIRCYRCGE